MQTDRLDVYTRVTNQIIADLEQGVRPWVQPWEAAHAAGDVSRPLRFNGLPYRGINVVLLWLSAMRQRFACPLWMTYRQASELGGQVRRGEKGSLVVYADRITRRETGEDGLEQEYEVPFMKGYMVFNCEQIDGLPARYYAEPERTSHPVERIEQAERFFANTGAEIRHGGGLAYYTPQDDHVQMPPIESFRDAEGFYATLAHEILHNAETRIMPTRLPRPRLARRRGLRQRLLTEEPWTLAGQSHPTDDRRDGSGGRVKPHLYIIHPKRIMSEGYPCTIGLGPLGGGLHRS